MHKKKGIINKTIILGILILFIWTGILPTIARGNNNNQDTIIITFYTFDKTGTKEHKVEVPTEIAEDISIRFEELKYKIIDEPISDETQLLKNEFVETLDAYGLITKKI